MNLFDMRTIVFSYVISNAVCMIVMAVLWLRNRDRFAGLGFWLADFVMQFTAVFLVALRGMLPDVLSMVLSNALVIGGTILLYIGLERFVDRRTSQIHNYFLLGAFIFIHTYFALIQPSLLMRTTNLAVGIILICGQCAWLLIRRVEADMRVITRGVGYIFLAFCLFSIVRIFADLVVNPGNDFFRSGVFEALAVLINQMLFIALTFGLLLVVNRRLVADLARDIVERKRTEESLTLSEEKFFKAFQSSPDAILITRVRDGKLLEVNEGFSRLTGYTTTEALADTTINLGLWVNPQDREAFLAALQEKHRISNYEYDFRVKSGKVLNCVCSAEIIQLGGEAHVLSVVRDITDRKKAEEGLRRFELLSEHSRDSILLIRREDGRILEANAAALQAYGYSRDELLALTIRDLRAPSTHGLTADQMAQADAGGILFETVHLRKDGRTFPVEVSSQGATISGERTLISIVRDITERRQAEEEISSLSKFPTENPYPVLRAYNDGRVAYANAASRELLEMWGCKVEGYLPDEWKDLIAVTVDAASTKTMDVPCNDKVYSITLVPIVDGGYVNMYGSNITERKQAEENQRHLAEALQQRLDEIQTLMDVVPVGIAIGHDPEGKVITVNRLLSEWLSAPTGSNVSLSAPEEERQVQYEVTRKGQPVRVEELPIQAAALNAQKIRNDEFTIVRSDGRNIEMLANADPLFDNQGHVRGAIATYHDITDRKQAEETLRRKEAEIRSLYRSMSELFVLHEVIYDASGKATDYRILECNPAFEKITGIQREAAVGCLASEVYGTYEAPYLDIYAAVAESGDPIEFETEFSPMGKHFHISVFSPERGRFATLASDITERKRAEDELHRTLEELRYTNTELEEFAYVASHDLQEPLRGIAGLTQLLQRRYQGQLDSRADEYIEHIVDGTKRMQTLINDLLAYSRIGRRGNVLQTIEAEAALRAALKNLNAAVLEVGATVKSESLPKVRADATQLIQVFQNLLGNALKFRSDRPAQIQISIADAGDFWQFSVKDNGIGIEPQYFERIFQVFQRLHTRREYRGNGIGLAICKKIIERHGGHIWVDSEIGQGTTFYFTLPKGN